MKKRKGFREITIDGKAFLFNWAHNQTGPILVLFSGDDLKTTIPYKIWNLYPASQEYLEAEKTWHGKHKTEACFGGWGKREAREMYLKWLKFNSQ